MWDKQYSVTFYDTYGKERKTYWNEELVTKIKKIEDAVICVVGNKTDLSGKKEVCDDEVRDFANKKITYISLYQRRQEKE